MFKHTTEHSFITKHVMKENMEYQKSGKRYSIINIANVLWGLFASYNFRGFSPVQFTRNMVDFP